MEPEFISQCGGVLSADERRSWFKDRAREARELGCNYCRYSIHPTEPNLILFEGWKVLPESDGEPRWQFSAGEKVR